MNGYTRELKNADSHMFADPRKADQVLDRSGVYRGGNDSPSIFGPHRVPDGASPAALETPATAVIKREVRLLGRRLCAQSPCDDDL